MLGIMLRKLVSKKWMFACLLLGCVLLIATIVSFPLYKNAAFDRMLRDEFTVSLMERGEWPTKLKMATVSEQRTGGARLFEMEELLNNLDSMLGVTTKEKVFFYRMGSFRVISLMDRKDTKNDIQMRLSYMSGLPEHVTLLGGQMYSETGITEDGDVEVVVTPECLSSLGLLQGERLQFNVLKNKQKKALTVKIVGVVQPNEGDYYWDIGEGELSNACFMNEDLFREYFVDNNIDQYTITCVYRYLFEYEQLTNEDVDGLVERFKEYLGNYQIAFADVIDTYVAKRDRVAITLFILQVPVLVLLGAFLFMISGQMYELEKNEISVIKSRGSSGGQIFRLYIYQSIFLTAVGALLGVPLGIFFSKVLGSASNFLEFGLRRRLDTRFTEEVWLYLAVAVAVTILIMAVPAIKHSKVSIVHLKQKKASKNKGWWEKFFLDFICLAIAIYGYRNYIRNQDQLLQNVLMGRPLDPLLYLCSALFIVGMGLLYLRVQPLIVKLVYLIGQKIWRPASYASFMESLKNGRKQQFIMLFLILTIALGMFHATVARTILQNTQKNTEYLDGADVVMKEVWRSNQVMKGDEIDGFVVRYYEPDINKYAALDFSDRYTKVMHENPMDEINPSYKVSIERNNVNYNVQLMAIQTKEFGEITGTHMDRELLEKPYYTYLNELAEEPQGVLMSRNCQTELGLEVGNAILINYTDDVGNAEFAAKVVDFVDYWPGYAPTYLELTNSGDGVITNQNYLVVANIATMQNVCSGVQPYEIWMELNEDADAGAPAEWINGSGISVTKYTNLADDLQADMENPLFQGTNGVLTMGFLVMILLCGVGYLIYWIMSIRSRELMFGVLRAFGMHKKELFHMLLIEQFFSGVLTILAGIGIGKLVSQLFVPMLQTAYAVSNQVLPMEMCTNTSDMLRLYGALALVMVICLAVLIVLVVKLNVTKALKLGEE